METETINKKAIIEHLKHLNEYEYIKVDGQDKQRLIFKNGQEVFSIFGSEDKEVLNPFNDYTYEWLNSFLSNVIDLLEINEYSNFEELSEDIQDHISEWSDSETDIYTSDLTEWLHYNNNNVYYIEESIKEFGINTNDVNGFSILMTAQYMAIQELFNSALCCLMDYLKDYDLDSEH